MKLTKRQQWGLAVLGALVAALAVDRLALLSEQAAPSRAAAESRRETGETAYRQVAVQERPSLAKRLARLAEQEGLDPEQTIDAFSTARAEWAAAAGAEAFVPQTGPAAFEARHELNAVMIAGAKRGAMVDGLVVRIGQEIDGYRLISVRQDAAEFEGPRGKALLRMASHDASP